MSRKRSITVWWILSYTLAKTYIEVVSVCMCLQWIMQTVFIIFFSRILCICRGNSQVDTRHRNLAWIRTQLRVFYINVNMLVYAVIWGVRPIIWIVNVADPPIRLVPNLFISFGAYSISRRSPMLVQLQWIFVLEDANWCTLPSRQKINERVSLFLVTRRYCDARHVYASNVATGAGTKKKQRQQDWMPSRENYYDPFVLYFFS